MLQCLKTLISSKFSSFLWIFWRNFDEMACDSGDAAGIAIGSILGTLVVVGVAMLVFHFVVRRRRVKSKLPIPHLHISLIANVISVARFYRVK